MGLDVTHGAFHGAYSAFNRFRQAVAEAAGGSYPPHDPKHRDAAGNALDPNQFYVEAGVTRDSHPGLYLFLECSDCDGEFSPEECALVSKDLEQLIPRFANLGEGTGHIQGAGGYLHVLQNFIDGCRAAHAAGEPLLFQ